MSFGREKRLLLGILALLAPLPLPFNDVLGWPVLLLFSAAVLVFLRRAARDPATWLPGWAMNLLGLAYLPVLYVDLAVFWTGQLVRPVIHLALFAVAVKLFALRQERDKWHVVIGVFFLFLAAMGTSVHPTILLYLAAFIGLSTALLARFAYFSVLARFGYRRVEPAPVPLRAFVIGATVAAMLAAAPLFALLPRIRTPYLLVRGTGTGTVVHAAGFSDLITLDSIDSSRISRQVLLRLRFTPQPRPRHEIRLKAATYDRYDGRTWRANGGGYAIAPQPGGTFRLGAARPVQNVEMWLLPWSSPALPVPVEATAVAVRTLSLARDRGGALSLYFVPATTLRYDAELAERPVLDEVPPPELGKPGEPSLDARAATSRIAALAAQVMGRGSPGEQAVRLERYLATQYQYTTEFVGRSGQFALEDFLFRTRRGHCEFFATAMVVMLRSQGVPARFVTGFLGGEPSAFEGYYIVRQSNAHAWVEAWEGSAWQVYDPTPAAGRPGAPNADFSLLASEVFDYLMFRWDRYVLTYGFYDQVQLLMDLRSAWFRVWQVFERQRPEAATSAPAAGTLPAGTAPGVGAASGWRRWRSAAAAAVAALALAGVAMAAWQQRRRRRCTATALYRRLRERLDSGGLPVPPSLAPLALARTAARRFPAAAPATERLVDLYLRESFASEALSEGDLGAAQLALRQVEQVLRKTG